MVGGASPNAISRAAERYESALQGEVDEASTAPGDELTLLDQRLANQEAMLRRAAVAADPAAASGVGGAIDAVARERVRLRAPAWSGCRRRQRPRCRPKRCPIQGARPDAMPTLAPSATPEPSATAPMDAQGSGGLVPDQGGQESCGLGPARRDDASRRRIYARPGLRA